MKWLTKREILKGKKKTKSILINQNDDLKKIPSGSSWKKILLEIYRFAPHQYGQSSKKQFNEDDHDLAKEIKISGDELRLGISFLKNNGLIEEHDPNTPLEISKGNWSTQLTLTEKGFNVALDLEKHKDNTRLNFGMWTFTGALVLISLLDLIMPITRPELKGPVLISILLVIAAIIFLNFLLNKR